MSCICQRALHLPSTYRAFSTSARRSVSLGLGANDKEIIADVVPAYPYGPTQWYKQAAQGLYGGQMIRYGNTTNEKYRTKFRRTWQPNVRSKRVFSKALNSFVKIRVTTTVLRTIDKLGGLDEYLLGEKAARIKELGEAGWWLRWAIMQTKPVQERFAAQRAALGLAPVATEDAMAVLTDEVVENEASSSTEELTLEQLDEIVPLQDGTSQEDAVEDTTLSAALGDSIQSADQLEMSSKTRDESTDIPEEGATQLDDMSSTSEVDAALVENVAAGESDYKAAFIARAEQMKDRLTFRVNKHRYVTLKDGQWVGHISKRSVLIKAMRYNSPMGALKQWDLDETERERQGLPAREKDERLQWFKDRQKLYEEAVKRFALVKLHEIYDDEDQNEDWWNKALHGKYDLRQEQEKRRQMLLDEQMPERKAERAANKLKAKRKIKRRLAELARQADETEAETKARHAKSDKAREARMAKRALLAATDGEAEPTSLLDQLDALSVTPENSTISEQKT